MPTERQLQHRRKGTIVALLAALRASADKLEESITESYAQHCLTDIAGRVVQEGIGRIIEILDGMTGELVDRLPAERDKPNRPRKVAGDVAANAPAEPLIENQKTKKGRHTSGAGAESVLPGGFGETKKPRKQKEK